MTTVITTNLNIENEIKAIKQLEAEIKNLSEIKKDKETVVIENKSGVGFTDRKITGSLEITKKDISSGKKIHSLLTDISFAVLVM